MKMMFRIKSLVLLLSLFSFVRVLIYMINNSESYVLTSKPISITTSIDIYKTKFLYINDSVMYSNKRCFHLKWKYTSNRWPLSDLRTSRCQRFITIAKSEGRTGNDLFQIATILGLAYRHDLIPVIPSSYHVNTYFDLPNIVDFNKRNLSNNVILLGKKVAIYKDLSKGLKSESYNFTIAGCFQSWRYFDTERDIVKNALRLKYVHFNRAKQYMNLVNPKGFKQATIHIRRGDFSTPGNLKKGFAVVDATFVEKAKHILQQNTSDIKFFVVTNDKKWCEENLNNVHISPFDNPGDDLAIMALSDHVIVSAGTFGWWGAWLAGGKAVYYKEFPRSKSNLAKLFNIYDYYLPDWIGIT
ncbi:galactoside alpha-(1,2)-fucosyltransferase 1-like [Ruditapes philippinarum]|uniref:galactoside alpha-(1,2)-fucosyltransferase 1-like n=1 Tax=Ruditapes philippinarum TaxID=129788 RepID=UPI00295AC82E|nr:galactoside alpha-(1,2)-fucosyltransferase 1-like [Ruditapes philippinarum]